MSSHIKGYCADCNESRTLVAKGLCSSCYQRQKRVGSAPTDCFALDLHKLSGQCNVMQGNCRLMHPDPARRVCPFRRTKDDYIKSKLAALERIASLPAGQQEYIRKTYWTQKEE